MLPLKQVLPADQRELLKLYASLSEVDRRSLLSFGRFLANQPQQKADDSADDSISAEPLDISRPENETVIKAIRRLSQSYPMLDKGRMVEGTSLLMSAHVLQGKAAEQVIDELELLFEQHYAAFVSVDDEKGE